MTLVNAYVAYVVAHTLIFKKKKEDIFSLYKFWKSVALGLITPESITSTMDVNDVNSEATSPSVGQQRKSKTVTFVSRRNQLKNSDTKDCTVNDNTFHPIDGSLRCRLN